jgi:hypothetical protein
MSLPPSQASISPAVFTHRQQRRTNIENRNGDRTDMTVSLNPPLKAGQVWDAGVITDGAMNQRGRWGVKREAHKIVVFYRFFFPKLETVIRSFDPEQEGAARVYAHLCFEQRIIPDREQKG